MNSDIRVQSRPYSTGTKRRNALKEALSEIHLEDTHAPLIRQLKRELSELIKTPYFGKFTPDFDIESLDFSIAYEDVKKNAPI